ncbi:MAG: Xaa-Pro peptidase family protein [Ignavibacteriaceae bacterium]|nr:Xaa-Pro peptidase family protein [Ignavibacteriaceae bacterium]
MDNIIKEKIRQSVSILKEKNIDMWLTFARESAYSKDPVMDIIVGTNVTWESAFTICSDGSHSAIIGSLDVANMKAQGIYEDITGYIKSIKEPLLNLLNNKKPRSIAVNYSKNSNIADGLSHGMYLILMDYLKGTIYADKLISSEEIISALKGRKTPSELVNMTEAVNVTLSIYDEVTKFMKPGMTEKHVADFITGLVKAKGLESAWEEDQCPAVYTGPGTAGAHAEPTKRIIKKGHVLNIDFGVKINGYCSDLQRTWYFLQDGEDKAPAEVQRGFDVIKDSIQMVADKVKPGVMGYEMDLIARDFIVKNGYEEYPHGLGHQVGKIAHDGGCGFFPRWDRYGTIPYMKVEESQVYTIEPRLPIKDFGVATIEEEILVTKDGCRFISPPQKELYLIKS